MRENNFRRLPWLKKLMQLSNTFIAIVIIIKIATSNDKCVTSVTQSRPNPYVNTKI